MMPKQNCYLYGRTHLSFVSLFWIQWKRYLVFFTFFLFFHIYLHPATDEILIFDSLIGSLHNRWYGILCLKSDQRFDSHMPQRVNRTRKSQRNFVELLPKPQAVQPTQYLSMMYPR